MKPNYLKYKIVYQSKENVWGKYNHIKKFKKQKWIKTVKKLDRPRKFHLYRRPRSNRILFRQRLLTKQTFKNFYGNLSYTTLKKEYHQTSKTTHLHPVQNLIVSLERRLDVFLFRSGLFTSIFEAKQAILHKKIFVNNQIVSNGNYRLHGGDFIRIPPSTTVTTLRNVPYAQINSSLNLLVFLRNPAIQEIRYPFQLNLNFLTNYLTTK